MNRLLLISLALNVVLLMAVLLVRTEPIVNADGEKCARASGDANGDGETDMTDAVHILSALFLGTPDPVPLCAAGGESSLPATGQSQVRYPGDDASYRTGCPIAGRFVDNRDGTVTDNCTGLMWQKETAPGVYSSSAAIEYCESLALAGHEDWRLPNVRELQSIVDYGRWGPAIDPAFQAGADWYWSSSAVLNSTDAVWMVLFNCGYVGHDIAVYTHFVRAVRGGL